MTNKYYRARISEAGVKGFKTIDMTGFTGMNKAKTSLRGNGYKVSIIVEITNQLEMRQEAFDNGSFISTENNHGTMYTPPVIISAGYVDSLKVGVAQAHAARTM